MAYTAENSPYKRKSAHGLESGSKASYTPNSNIDEHSYGKDGGKPNAVTGVPSVVVGGASESAPLPKAFTGNFSIGEDKNVSEIIGY